MAASAGGPRSSRHRFLRPGGPARGAAPSRGGGFDSTINEGHRKHFAAMNVPVATVAVAASQRSEVAPAFAAYHAALDPRSWAWSLTRTRPRSATRPTPQRHRVPGARGRAGDESERRDAIALGKQHRHLRGRHPASVDLHQVFVGRPTGDSAALSDEDRDCVISQLGKQVTNRRHAYALDAIGVVAEQQLRSVPAEHD